MPTSEQSDEVVYFTEDALSIIRTCEKKSNSLVIPVIEARVLHTLAESGATVPEAVTVLSKIVSDFLILGDAVNSNRMFWKPGEGPPN